MDSFEHIKNITYKELEEKTELAEKWLNDENKRLDNDYFKLMAQVEILQVICLEMTKEENRNQYRTWDVDYLNERINEDSFYPKTKLMIEVRSEKLKNKIKGF
jgi:hypothetical protein